MACVDRLEALTGFLQSVLGTSSFERVKLQQLQAVKKIICCSTLTLEQAADCNKKLRQQPWSDGERAELFELVASRINQGPAAAARSRSGMQDYASLPEYFSKAQWEQLTDTSTNASTKMEQLLLHVCKLGCERPSESTSQLVAAIFLFISEGLDGSRKLLPSIKLETLKTIKRQHKRIFKLACNAEAADGPDILPRNWQEFKLSFPDRWKTIFGDPARDEPVPCFIDLRILQEIMCSIPMRASRADTKNAVPQLQLHASPSVHEPVMQFAQCMMQHMQQMSRPHQVRFEALPGKRSFECLEDDSLPSIESSIVQTPSAQAAAKRMHSRLALPYFSDRSCDENLQATEKHEPALEPAIEPAPALQDAPAAAPAVAQGATRARSVDDVTKTMLQAMSAKKEGKVQAKRLDEQRPATNEEKGKSEKPSKAKTKGQPPRKNIKKPATSTKKPDKSDKPPHYSVEASRSQIMTRTGIAGAGQNNAIKYGKGQKYATLELARKAADKWLKNIMQQRGIC